MLTQNDYLMLLNSLDQKTENVLTEGSTLINYQQEKKDLENRYEEFKLCCEWIEKFSFEPTEKQWRKVNQLQTYNSYYLKHLVEKWSGKYISSGAFIMAVRHLQIPFKPIFGTPDISVTIFLREEAVNF